MTSIVKQSSLCGNAIEMSD